MSAEVSRVVKPKTIICFVGKSGTGKTTWALQFRKYMSFVSSRTTREARDGETHGYAPYHKFLDGNDYLRDIVTNGKVAMNDLSRGDDIMVADTSFGGNTYWAMTSDIFKDDDPIVGYIIDPAGVAKLFQIQNIMTDKLTENGWNSTIAPYIHALAFSRILVVYVDAEQEILDKIPQTRKDRDNTQETGWALCEGFSFSHITTTYIEDVTKREEHMDDFARRTVQRWRMSLL